MVVTGTILGTARSAVHDGPGVRTVVFFKGCPLRCTWCHSPESQAPTPEVMLRTERCIACGFCLETCTSAAVVVADSRFVVDRAKCRICGECGEVCPAGAREIAGRNVTIGELMREIERDVVFYDQSGGGVTASGGEPLQQAGFLEELLKQCRRRRISTVVETCGLARADALLAVARYTDLFLYDLKLMDDARHRAKTGGSNRRILENLRLLATEGASVRVRFPLIPGITDDRSNVHAIGTLLAELHVCQVDVLPYHRAGLAKYDRLDRTYALADVPVPSAVQVEEVAAALRRHGLQVQTGGAR
jgi:pyruvate formate lyase activating enzyme